jgi:hypothetical protein
MTTGFMVIVELNLLTTTDEDILTLTEYTENVLDKVDSNIEFIILIELTIIVEFTDPTIILFFTLYILLDIDNEPTITTIPETETVTEYIELEIDKDSTGSIISVVSI